MTWFKQGTTGVWSNRSTNSATATTASQPQHIFHFSKFVFSAINKRGVLPAQQAPTTQRLLSILFPRPVTSPPRPSTRSSYFSLFHDDDAFNSWEHNLSKNTRTWRDVTLTCTSRKKYFKIRLRIDIPGKLIGNTLIVYIYNYHRFWN